MTIRRLVGIDLGIASAHTVRVLEESGQTIAKRKAVPTVESLTEVEVAALAGAPDGTRLEVVIEPTGPAWLPIAVFFSNRGHVVHRVSSAKASDLRRFLSRHTKTNGIDADTLARIPLFDPSGLQPLVLPDVDHAMLDRRVRACDRLTQTASRHKVRIKDLVRQLLPMTESLELYGSNPSVAFSDLAAEVATEVRLLRAVQNELAVHASEREAAYRKVDPAGLARSLPGLADVGGPNVIAIMGDPTRFDRGKQFRSFTGLVARTSETGETNRKGQPMSKAGSSLLRTTFVRAADHARKQDPQLARIYHVQMVERGKDHLGALCVVAANLAERTWVVMRRQTPYVICDTNNRSVTPAEATAIIAEHFTVPAEVRARRRSKKMGKAPQAARTGRHERGDPPQKPSFSSTRHQVNRRPA